MGFLGQFLLSTVFALCCLAIACGLATLKMAVETAKRLFSLAKTIILVAAGLSVIVLILLAAAFLTDDFSIAAVSQFSSKDLPVFYKISAVWAGSAGSLLLWAVLLLVLFALWLTRLQANELKFNAVALAIGSAVCCGFVVLLMVIVKPFAASAEAVQDGAGLNPLLRNFWMMSHPPLLFLGYSAFLIPFVIIIASGLTAGMTDFTFYRQLRRWLLLGICFLSLGIASGARWSYFVLGWGGYWAWDPVENASLLPWLLALAALHSLAGIGGAKKTRRWIVCLAPLPFILCLVATFITRSGILQSVHAFSENAMSSALLTFIACCVLLWLISAVLSVKNISAAGPSSEKTPGFKRGDVIFWAVVVLILTAVVIGTATFWPVISRFAANSTVSIGRTFYDRIVSAAGVVLAFLVGLAALAELRKRNGFMLKLFVCCFAAMAGVLAYQLCAVCYSHMLSLAVTVCAFSFAAILMKFASNLKIGAAIAHCGLLLLVIAVGFSSNEQVVSVQLVKGEKIKLGNYELTYNSFGHGYSDGITKVGPEIALRGNGVVRKLWPHNNLYPSGQKTSEVAVHAGLLEDVYILFDGVDWDGKAAVEIKIKPMMSGLWLACLLIIGGCAGAMFESER